MSPYCQKMQLSGCVCWVSATFTEVFMVIQFTVETLLKNTLKIFTILHYAVLHFSL